tara:strand:- start:734 stop:1015 length:282 start_codon:yes stop_codon:yes gene_type:complete
MTLTESQQKSIKKLTAQQRYYENNKQKCVDATMNWKHKNKEYISEYNKAYMRMYRTRNREQKGAKKLTPRSKLIKDDPIFDEYVNSLGVIIEN